MNTDGALNMIRNWRRDYEGTMYVGAGTVLDDETMARAAIDAGAQFLISPNVDESVIRYGGHGTTQHAA
ncbi:hypothetical protein EBB07_30620 [Paenibacillaceae bacterium]|nr:hypothetical protein EBB07_30620 [Paenibacillaceae bacterium]